jgi:hypothetical protein
VSIIPADPNSLAALLAEHERRLAQLERAVPYSTGWLDDDGVERVVVGRLDDDTDEYGVRILDETDAPRVQLGVLQDGGYGLGVRNDAGQIVNVLRSLTPVAEDIDDTDSTSSLSYVNLAHVGPTVTVDVGETGRVLATASAFIGLDNTGMTAAVSIFVDGVGTAGALALSNQTALLAASCCSTQVIEGLTPGPHTFQMRYKVTSGTGNFSSRTLLVQPY